MKLISKFRAILVPILCLFHSILFSQITRNNAYLLTCPEFSSFRDSPMDWDTVILADVGISFSYKGFVNEQVIIFSRDYEITFFLSIQEQDFDVAGNPKVGSVVYGGYRNEPDKPYMPIGKWVAPKLPPYVQVKPMENGFASIELFNLSTHYENFQPNTLRELRLLKKLQSGLTNRLELGIDSMTWDYQAVFGERKCLTGSHSYPENQFHLYGWDGWGGIGFYYGRASLALLFKDDELCMMYLGEGFDLAKNLEEYVLYKRPKQYNQYDEFLILESELEHAQEWVEIMFCDVP